MKPLPTIVLSQFCCTSLWFASNAVMNGLTENFGLGMEATAYLTSAIQFGFILGTLVFAVLTITDRFSPSRVFFVCALAGACLNGLVTWDGNSLQSLLILRLLTGFCLAGIYPVGMKIAADYFDKGLGTSLGFLVGALVLGTAFPQSLMAMGISVNWKAVLLTASGLAILGGVLLLFFVPDGPHRRPGQGVKLGAFLSVFRKPDFRAAAFGYFGHMWELYAFWTFVPGILLAYTYDNEIARFNLRGWSFLIIGIGSVACVAGGFLARRFGEKKVAAAALALSGACCLLMPFAYELSFYGLVAFLLFWGMVVIMDSPLFSTLVAKSAPPALKGTALTIVNCIGFAITIISIQLVGVFQGPFGIENVLVILAIGPAVGLLALGLSRKKK